MASEGGDFEKGLNAQKCGNYAAALTEWAPLAAKGNAIAQFHLG